MNGPIIDETVGVYKSLCRGVVSIHEVQPAGLSVRLDA